MKAKVRNGEQWKLQHNLAVSRYCPVMKVTHENAYLRMLQGWEGYATVHKSEFESSIGDDNVLGPAWEAIGDSLRELLNGEVGPRLDCGTLDSFILNTMRSNTPQTRR